MVLDEYNRDPKKWQHDAQVELYTITLPVSRWLREPSQNGVAGPVMKNATPAQVQAAEAQAMAAAREIEDRLKKGADFAHEAEDNSADPYLKKGGKVGMVSRGDLSDNLKKLEDYAFNLPANTLGDPLLLHETDYTQSTVRIVKVGRKVEAHTDTFDEVQGDIRTALETKQIGDLRVKEVNSLMSKKAIEAVDRMKDVALDAAIARYATK